MGPRGPHGSRTTTWWWWAKAPGGEAPPPSRTLVGFGPRGEAEVAERRPTRVGRPPCLRPLVGEVGQGGGRKLHRRTSPTSVGHAEYLIRGVNPA